MTLANLLISKTLYAIDRLTEISIKNLATKNQLETAFDLGNKYRKKNFFF